MADFWYTFKSCGAISFLILLIGVMGFAAAVGAIVISLTEKRGRFALMVALGALVIGTASLGAGALGEMLGRSRTDQVLEAISSSEMADSEARARIREEGYAESAGCMSLGMYAGALPLLSGLLGLVAFFVRKKSDDPSRIAEE